MASHIKPREAMTCFESEVCEVCTQHSQLIADMAKKRMFCACYGNTSGTCGGVGLLEPTDHVVWLLSFKISTKIHVCWTKKSSTRGSTIDFWETTPCPSDHPHGQAIQTFGFPETTFSIPCSSSCEEKPSLQKLWWLPGRHNGLSKWWRCCERIWLLMPWNCYQRFQGTSVSLLCPADLKKRFHQAGNRMNTYRDLPSKIRWCWNCFSRNCCPWS